MPSGLASNFVIEGRSSNFVDILFMACNSYYRCILVNAGLRVRRTLFNGVFSRTISVSRNKKGYKSSVVAEMGNRGHNRHGLKRGGLLCPFRERAGSLSNTMWPGPKSTSLPSDIFIHPAFWPQCTWDEKTGGSAPLRVGKAATPSNATSPGQVAS